MNSAIVQHLEPEFEPVAVVWSDESPENAIEFAEGRFGCILNLFAEASLRGRVAGGSRETIVCTGGRAALGFGVDFLESDDRLDQISALFSKGLASARDTSAYGETGRFPSWIYTWRTASPRPGDGQAVDPGLPAQVRHPEPIRLVQTAERDRIR